MSAWVPAGGSAKDILKQIMEDHRNENNQAIPDVLGLADDRTTE